VSNVSGEGSLLLNNDGTNPLNLNNSDGVLEFSGDRTSTVSHVKINSGDASNWPLIRMISSGVVNNLTHIESSEINISSGKTLSITEDFIVPDDKRLKITGADGTLSLGGKMTLAGTLNFTDNNSTLDGGNLALNGGILQAEDDINLKSNLLQSAESKIVAASGKTINYSGASLSLGANTLRITGGGAFSNTNSLVLDDAASKLHLSSITVGSASTSVDDSLGVVVENDSTISNFAVSNTTPVSIASGKTLEGSIGVTAGSLKLTETGTLASAVSMSGGTTLDADNSLTVSGALTHAGDITIDVAGTLTYTGAPISIGEHTLKLIGGGSLLSGGLDINKAASKLLLSSITVDNVSTSVGDSLGVVVENDSTISNFAVSKITPVSIASGKTLSGSIGVTAGSIKLTETGTLASAVSMSGGTTLDADNSLTVSGALTHAGDITIDVAGTRTLTYTGTPISLGEHTLKLSGGGSLLSGGLDINNAASKLLLSSITVDSVSTSVDDSLGVVVDNDSTISNFAVSKITPVSIASGKTLSGSIGITAGSLKLTDTGSIASAVSMSGGTTLDADNSLTVSGTLTHTGDITIDVLDNKILSYSGAPLSLGSHTLSILGAGILSNVSGSPLVLDQTGSILDLKGSGTVSGAVKLESGTLKSSGSATISGVLTQYSDATIEVPASQTLSYSGASLSLGANTLRITGGGAFSNTNSLVLDDAASKLHLSSITVGSVSTSVDDSLGVVVENDSTISNFAVSNTTPVSIASGKTLEGSIGVTAGSLKLTETGTLASAVSMSGGTTLDADNSLTVSGALTHAGDITIDVAGTLTYTGAPISIGEHTLKLIGGGSLLSGGLDINKAASKLL
ncbi:hypothetical protein N9357_06760, partial [bacterium]|nr:hypothetical protein [bacterium]